MFGRNGVQTKEKEKIITKKPEKLMKQFVFQTERKKNKKKNKRVKKRFCSQ
jgi:hypothetical protein